jgi:hypothetical protein
MTQPTLLHLAAHEAAHKLWTPKFREALEPIGPLAVHEHCVTWSADRVLTA